MVVRIWSFIEELVAFDIAGGVGKRGEVAAMFGVTGGNGEGLNLDGGGVTSGCGVVGGITGGAGGTCGGVGWQVDGVGVAAGGDEYGGYLWCCWSKGWWLSPVSRWW
ncbi:hypothetical protein Ancab_016530 [Ancistrocladus abbreviatus]